QSRTASVIVELTPALFSCMGQTVKFAGKVGQAVNPGGKLTPSHFSIQLTTIKLDTRLKKQGPIAGS
ncbi:MAG: hypothetical protein WCQ94_10125, partial [Lachnospiraceae bacterium]